jgi:hypothetical protein
VGRDEKDWWGSILLAQGEHQEGTIPAKFAQIFKENFMQSLGERNSREEKFNEIFSRFTGTKFLPPYAHASSPMQGIPILQNHSVDSSQIPSSLKSHQV